MPARTWFVRAVWRQTLGGASSMPAFFAIHSQVSFKRKRGRPAKLILTRQLSGRGIGWVDAHLLASALVAGCGLWTFDGRLGAVARDLSVVSVHGPLQ